MTRPILALLVLAAAAPVAAQEAPPRHRVAVMHFDYSPVEARIVSVETAQVLATATGRGVYAAVENLVPQLAVAAGKLPPAQTGP